MEKIEFVFDGKLAERHMMNFYEASRFQYAASRLLVKLAQFRSTGRFNQKITNTSNVGIVLTTQDEGSFKINVKAPSSEAAGNDDQYIDMTLGDLLAYVTERLIAKTDDDDLRSALNSNRTITDRFGIIPDSDGERLQEVLREVIEDPELRRAIFPEQAALFERRISEIGRTDMLAERDLELRKIDPAREQKLISMAGPLVSEMATALRRSATTLHIAVGDGRRTSNVLFLNQSMADDIESTRIDQEVTLLLGDIIQYNKETGWGKVRLGNTRQTLSFNVPSDRRNALQSELLTQMRAEQVFLQVYIVRDKARQPVRVVLTGIYPAPTD